MRQKDLKILAISAGAAAGLGAATMFFLDPDRGKRRRALVGDKTASVARRSGSFFGKAARDLEHRTLGAVAKTRSRPGPGEADDMALVERLRSRIGRAVRHPGALSIEVKKGAVTARGDMLQTELSDLLSAIYSTRGVREVRNKVKVHPSSTTIPALQGGQRAQPAALARFRRRPGLRLALGAAGGALAVYGMRYRSRVGRMLGALGVGLLSTEMANAGFSQLAQGVEEHRKAA